MNAYSNYCNQFRSKYIHFLDARETSLPNRESFALGPSASSMEEARSHNVPSRQIYVIKESHQLPQIDCFRALKHVLLEGRHLRFCNRWLSKYKNWLAVFFVIGVLNAFVVPFLPAEHGRFAVFVGLLELPTLVAVFISLRYDMIKLTLSTYEFWYIVWLNMAFTIATIPAYQDTRFLSFIPSFMGTELLALQDANFRALGFTIWVFSLIGVLHVIIILYINLQLIEQWHIVELFRYGNHAFTANNIISTYFGFTAIVLFRNAYRKHRWVRDDIGKETTVVRCIAYRCRVRLCLANLPQIIDLPNQLEERMTQMRLVPSDQVYDANEILLQWLVSASYIRSCFDTRSRNLIVLFLIGAIALALTITALVIEPIKYDTKLYALVSVSSTISSGIFCGFFMSLYQQQLLLRLVSSFDFMFLSANITMMHICVSDALAWTSKGFAVLSCWMWVMWAVTTDALTPNMRNLLGLRQRHLFCVISLFLVLVVMLVVELTVLQTWSLQDRCLFQFKALKTTVDIQVFQVFFSCLISSFPMFIRILWRLHKAQHGDLILIHGAVEYDDLPLAQRRKRKRPNSRESQRSSVTSSLVVSWFHRQAKIHPTGVKSNLFRVQSG